MFNNKNITLTISIVNWNAGNYIIECLKSIIDTINNVTYLIYVVDNNSTDNSVERIKKSFPHVNIIENTENIGYSRAHNQVISLAISKYILLINPDCVVTENAIEQMIGYMESHTNSGLTVCKVVSPDGNDESVNVSSPGVYSEFKKEAMVCFYPFNSIISKYILKSNNINYSIPKEIYFIRGPFLFIRMEMLKNIGLLEESYFLFYEELDLCIRIKKYGWNIDYIPGSIVYHALGKSRDLAPKEFSEYHCYRSGLLFFRKMYGLKSAIMVSIIYVIFNLWLIIVDAIKSLFYLKRRTTYYNIGIVRIKAVVDVVLTGYKLNIISKSLLSHH